MRISRKNLIEVIERENMIRSYRNLPPMSIKTLTQEDSDILVRSIDCSLSPENLHCDGEISRAQAQIKFNKLTSALIEVRNLGFFVRSYEWDMVNS